MSELTDDRLRRANITDDKLREIVADLSPPTGLTLDVADGFLVSVCTELLALRAAASTSAEGAKPIGWLLDADDPVNWSFWRSAEDVALAAAGGDRSRVTPVVPLALLAEGSTSTEAVGVLEQLRADGWMVAVHNDYRQSGERHTFWLLTHPNGRWVKGEGPTDAIALDECASAALTPPTLKVTTDEAEERK